MESDKRWLKAQNAEKTFHKNQKYNYDKKAMREKKVPSKDFQNSYDQMD